MNSTILDTQFDTTVIKNNKHFDLVLLVIPSVIFILYCSENISFKQLDLFKFLAKNEILQHYIWTHHNVRMSNTHFYWVEP